MIMLGGNTPCMLSACMCGDGYNSCYVCLSVTILAVAWCNSTFKVRCDKLHVQLIIDLWIFENNFIQKLRCNLAYCSIFLKI